MAEFCKIRSDGSVMAAPNPLLAIVASATSGKRINTLQMPESIKTAIVTTLYFTGVQQYTAQH